MLKIYQQTISKSINFEGVGLHSGVNSKIKIKPGKGNQGIIFIRTDLKKNNEVIAKYGNVSSAKLCTTLINQYGTKVSTVEHLLAALYIHEIDNAIIEINSEEVPIMDGSAKNFLHGLGSANIKIQNEKRKYLKIEDSVEYVDGEKKISIQPSDFSFEVDFQLNYSNELIGKQRNSINLTFEKLEDICNARTFCLFEDIEKIKKIGLAKGGSLDNAVVVKGNKVLNEGGLRHKKEFVNHKILDLVGDFLLSGYRVLGKVECYQGGHELTNKFLRKLLSSNSSISTLELKEILVPKKALSEKLVKLAVNA